MILQCHHCVLITSSFHLALLQGSPSARCARANRFGLVAVLAAGETGRGRAVTLAEDRHNYKVGLTCNLEPNILAAPRHGSVLIWHPSEAGWLGTGSCSESSKESTSCSDLNASLLHSHSGNPTILLPCLRCFVFNALGSSPVSSSAHETVAKIFLALLDSNTSRLEHLGIPKKGAPEQSRYDI